MNEMPTCEKSKEIQRKIKRPPIIMTLRIINGDCGGRELFSISGWGGRDGCFDIAKGIGIILMVCGHARAPFSGFLTLFHMALFFMISGYLYNDRQANSLKEVLNYTKKKIRTLWRPYFIWNTIFVLLNNVFIECGIYSTNPLFLRLVTGERNELARYFGLGDGIKEITKGFFMLDTVQVGGALWFLRAVFIISVGHNY